MGSQERKKRTDIGANTVLEEKVRSDRRWREEETEQSGGTIWVTGQQKSQDKGETSARRRTGYFNTHHSVPLCWKESFVSAWNAASVGKRGVKSRSLNSLTGQSRNWRNKLTSRNIKLSLDSLQQILELWWMVLFFILEKSCSLQCFSSPVSILHLYPIMHFISIFI